MVKCKEGHVGVRLIVKLLSKLKTVAAKKQTLIWETKFLKEDIGVSAEVRKCYKQRYCPTSGGLIICF